MAQLHTMKKKILVIDESNEIRLYIENILSEKYELILKDDGQKAVNWLNESNPIDLILLDMEIPNINGRVFIRKVKYSFTHQDVPVIVMSTTDSKLIRHSFLNLGASDYILKPFEEIDFKERVEKAIMQGCQ